MNVFNQSLNMSKHTGQGQRPLMNTSDHLAFKQLPITSRHAAVINRNTWTWKCLEKKLQNRSSTGFYL